MLDKAGNSGNNGADMTTYVDVGVGGGPVWVRREQHSVVIGPSNAVDTVVVEVLKVDLRSTFGVSARVKRGHVEFWETLSIHANERDARHGFEVATGDAGPEHSPPE